MAKQATKTEMANDILNLANENKELKKQIGNLKRSNAAYKGINKYLHESVNDLQKDYNAIIKEKEMFKNIDNKSLNSVIEKQKAEIIELKEKNAAQVGVIKAKEDRLQELLSFNVGTSKLIRHTEADSNVKSELIKLLSIPEDSSYADILNGLTSLRLKYEEALGNGSDVKRALALPANAKAEDILNAIDETNVEYIRSIRKSLNLQKGESLKEEIVKLKSYTSEPIAFPLYMNLCNAMGELNGIKAEELIDKVKQMVVDNFNLNANNESYKSYYNSLKKGLNLKQGERIHNKIGELQADLEAARKQEDINARALSEIENILEKTMGIFQLEEIEKVIHDLRKPDVRPLKEAIESVLGPKYIQYAGRGKRYDDAKKELLETLKRTLDHLALKEIDSIEVRSDKFYIAIAGFKTNDRVTDTIGLIESKINTYGCLPNITIHQKNGFSIGIININK